jgi:hypothetical protein
MNDMTHTCMNLERWPILSSRSGATRNTLALVAKADLGVIFSVSSTIKSSSGPCRNGCDRAKVKPYDGDQGPSNSHW